MGWIHNQQTGVRVLLLALAGCMLAGCGNKRDEDQMSAEDRSTPTLLVRRQGDGNYQVSLDAPTESGSVMSPRLLLQPGQRGSVVLGSDGYVTLIFQATVRPGTPAQSVAMVDYLIAQHTQRGMKVWEATQAEFELDQSRRAESAGGR